MRRRVLGRVRRDPRRELEIRRLAMKARRSRGDREVLVDVLLETYPWLESQIEYAKQLTKLKMKSRAEGRTTKPYDYVVLFRANILGRGHKPGSLFHIERMPYRGKGWARALDDVPTNKLEDHYRSWEGSGYEHALVVYRTRGRL